MLPPVRAGSWDTQGEEAQAKFFFFISTLRYSFARLFTQTANIERHYGTTPKSLVHDTISGANTSDAIFL